MHVAMVDVLCSVRLLNSHLIDMYALLYVFVSGVDSFQECSIYYVYNYITVYEDLKAFLLNMHVFTGIVLYYVD